MAAGIVKELDSSNRSYYKADDIVSKGEPVAKKGDLLAMDDRYFLILLVDDTGALGIATIYYAEERNDLR